MSSSWYFLSPIDHWFFRDARPFTAQQNFVARSLFPPNTQTVMGAIKTAILDEHKVDWRQFKAGTTSEAWVSDVGGPSDFGRLELAGPFVARNADSSIERYVRAPSDLLALKGGQVVRLQPRGDYDFHTAL